MQNEKSLERRLLRLVKQKQGLCLKWVSPGVTGVPDRIVIHQGRVIFVELKDPKGVLSPRQRLVIQMLRDAGAEVSLLASAEEVDNFVGSL